MAGVARRMVALVSREGAQHFVVTDVVAPGRRGALARDWLPEHSAALPVWARNKPPIRSQRKKMEGRLTHAPL